MSVLTRWPHQLYALAEVPRLIGAGVRRVCLTTPAGGGKTLTACDLIEWGLLEDFWPIVYTNRKSLVGQLSRSLAKYGLDFGVRAAGWEDRRELRIQVSSLPTESARVLKAGKWQVHGHRRKVLAIVDECFPAGTLVDGRPIEDFRIGDMVRCVDHEAGHITRRPVIAVSCRDASSIIRVTFGSGRSLVCTPSHPVYSTTRGRYVSAIDLQPDEGVFRADPENAEGTHLCGVRDDVSDRATQTGVRPFLLRRGMQGEGSPTDELRQPGDEGEARTAADRGQPHATTVGRRKDAGHTQGDRASAFDPRRERPRGDSSAKEPGRRAGLADGGCSSDRAAAAEGRADLLQDRFGQSGVDGGDRDRRPQPRRLFAAGAGCSEAAVSGVERVVGVAIYQSTDRREFRRLCPGGVIFNLQVEEHANYFADGILVHNCHLNKSATASAILARHLDDGGAYVGLTATPVGLGRMYDRLVIAGTPSELRGYGAIVPAYHTGVDEPDMRTFKPNVKTGEYSEGDVVKAVMHKNVFGRVIDHYRALNTDGRPTILFAPGVRESVWFAEELCKAGHPAAHIDGKGVWVDGEYTTGGDRDLILARVAAGDVILCNRFVAREGLDIPAVSHVILATVMGAVQSFIQSCSRGGRAHPGKTRYTLQDHGGHWHRHGSVNADRDWKLTDTEASIAAARIERFRAHQDREPIRCPQCGLIRAAGPSCPQCGHETTRRTRIVVQQDGRLVEHEGDVYRPRKVKQTDQTEVLWKSCYFAAKNSGKTFRQARGNFYRLHGYWPPETLPLMPRESADWFLKVSAVPSDRLIPGRPREAVADGPNLFAGGQA